MPNRTKNTFLIAAAIASVCLSVFALQYVWKENGLRALEDVSEQRVRLVANAVKAEINRQDHLPVVLSMDADVRAALSNPQDPVLIQHLQHKLMRLGKEADTRALYIIGKDGVVLAADNLQSPESQIGHDLSDRIYFTEAAKNGRSTYLGLEQANDRVRYYLAEAVKNPELIGVAVVRIEFDQLESDWENAGERVFVTDKNGVVFLSSDQVYKYRSFGEPRPGVRDMSPHYPDANSAPVSFQTLEKRAHGSIIHMNNPADGTDYLYQTMSLPEYGWEIHRLTDLKTVHSDQRDGALIGGTLSALIIFLVLYLIQRHRAYVAERETGKLLKSEVEKRTNELRESNTSLQSEIDERRRTEVRLRAAQNELVQASKLAALGQMSAAIAHEINQPLAAIRTFLASTRIFAERGETAKVESNLDIVNGLAERMASITAHLKTFARKSEPGRPDPVDVGRAVNGALFMLESKIKSGGAHIEKNVASDIWVPGYAVQLEQVMLNLISNALDAVADVSAPWIGIRAWSEGITVYISVEDNGPGIPPDIMNCMFDPFITTKPVGKGLGLGLSVSYGIVQDFHGRIHAANRAEGGARLMIELPRLEQKAESLVNAAHA